MHAETILTPWQKLSKISKFILQQGYHIYIEGVSIPMSDFMQPLYHRVLMGHRKPGKSWNFNCSFSRP